MNWYIFNLKIIVNMKKANYFRVKYECILEKNRLQKIKNCTCAKAEIC